MTEPNEEQGGGQQQQPPPPAPAPAAKPKPKNHEQQIADVVHTLRDISADLVELAGTHPGVASLKKLLDNGLRFFSHVE